MSLLPYILACLGVLVVFGLPATLLLLPDPWKPWWPVALPIVGLATLVIVLQPLGTLFTVGGVVWPALLLAVAACVVAFAVGGRLVRPTAWALVMLVVAAGVGGLALRPSLRLGEPRPSGILNEDSIYYITVDRWLEHHGIRDAPPTPEQDGLWAPARAAYDSHVRVGVDLANIETWKLIGADPLDTLPVFAAIFVALAGMAVCLFVVALRGPPALAVLGGALAAVRPDLLRVGLDSFVAQAAGVGLFVAALAAIGLAVAGGRRRDLGMAALLTGGLIGTYVEFAPSLVASALLTAALLAVLGVVERRTDVSRARGAVLRVVATRLAVVGLIVVVIDPLAVYNGLRTLSAASSLSGEAIVPFLGIGRDLAIVTGPDSVVRTGSTFGLVLSIAAATLALAGALEQGRRRGALLVGAAAGGVALAIQQSWLHPYSYGLYKSLSLIAPFVAAGLALAIGGRSLGVRALAAACAAALLIANLQASVDISRASIGGFNGMIPDDAHLDDYARIAGPASTSVALEGTDLQGAANARQHYGVYWLRERDGLHVTYARGPGSYYVNGLKVGQYDVDKTYRPDYDHVVSWGPSLTHGKLVGTMRGWDVYAREGDVDLLQVGRDGWGFPTGTPQDPVRFDLGNGFFWVNAIHPAQVRLRLKAFSPLGTRAVRVEVDGRTVLRRTLGNARTSLVTAPFDVPRGRTAVVMKSQVSPIDPANPSSALGAGLVQARVEEVGDGR